jgi:hypothetical protein
MRVLGFKVTGENTGGAFGYFIVQVAPQGGPPLHVHHNQEGTIHVLKGRYKVRIGGYILHPWSYCCSGSGDGVHTNACLRHRRAPEIPPIEGAGDLREPESLFADPASPRSAAPGDPRSMKQGDCVTVEEAQRDMRIGMMGGFMGQLVSALLWLASAAFSTWVSPRSAIAVLVLVGFFIFPITKVGLRLVGHPKVSPGNPLNGLGMQAAFVLPLCLPLVAAATLYRLEWFYPAFMIALGAHYLPFVTLYGMRMFFALTGILVGAGVVLAVYLTMPFSTGAWFTAGALVVFAVLGGLRVRPELNQVMPPRPLPLS